MNKTVKDADVKLYPTYLKALMEEDVVQTTISYEGTTWPDCIELDGVEYRKRNFLRGSGKNQYFETVYIHLKN